MQETKEQPGVVITSRAMIDLLSMVEKIEEYINSANDRAIASASLSRAEFGDRGSRYPFLYGHLRSSAQIAAEDLKKLRDFIAKEFIVSKRRR